MKNQRWQDWTMFVLGVWLLISPLIGIGAVSDVAAINSYVVGSVVILLSIAAITDPHMWEEYTNLTLGVWLFLAPFVLGFSTLSGPATNQILVGFLIAISALTVTLSKSTPTAKHGHT